VLATKTARRDKDDLAKDFVASQWQLMRRKFSRHRLAVFSGIVLLLFYFVAIFCEFFATQDIDERDAKYMYAPPQKIHFRDQEGKFHVRPFVYGLQREIDPINLRKIYTEDKTQKFPLYFFVRGDEYRMWGLFKTNIHLIGTREGTFFLMGADKFGRDLFSRIIYASRITLSIGLMGVAISFVLGSILGGISGYFGGPADMLIQRIIEFLTSIPTLPLWMGLSAALPPNWGVIRVYFCIVVVLSIVGWCGLARVVRGKLISLREEDFVLAAKLAGTGEMKIITRHLLPSFLSYLIVSLTLAIPGMILGETALSFLGLGLRPPAVSWGVLLQEAQNIRAIAINPWLLIPALFVIAVVLLFNFLGDGLRDAADPYK
jgi:peptide/nickel transport system permease protein